MDPTDVALAEVVREAIDEAKLTQKGVAERIGLAPTTWKRRMLGASSFTFSELMRIAAAAGLPLSQLVERTEKRSVTRRAS